MGSAHGREFSTAIISSSSGVGSCGSFWLPLIVPEIRVTSHPAGLFPGPYPKSRSDSPAQLFPPLRPALPVSRRVNTSGGHDFGGEGMEKASLQARIQETPAAQQQFAERLSFAIGYVDAMDLTKMLDMEPGTRPLNGVRDLQSLFYPLRTHENMKNSVHRDPLSAWNYLCDKGGLELEGRDEGLDQRIHQ